MWRAALRSHGHALRTFRDGNADVVTSAVVAAGLGSLFPILMLATFWLLSQVGIWSLLFRGPFILLAFGSLLAVVYWRTARGRYRWNLTVAGQTLLVTALFALALASSTFCFTDHVCMDGHMQHPPYPIQEYLGDALWAGGLAVAAVVFTRMRSPAGIAAAAVSGFLVSFRFGFGSCGGILPFPL